MLFCVRAEIHINIFFLGFEGLMCVGDITIYNCAYSKTNHNQHPVIDHPRRDGPMSLVTPHSDRDHN